MDTVHNSRGRDTGNSAAHLPLREAAVAVFDSCQNKLAAGLDRHGSSHDRCHRPALARIDL